MPGKKKGNRVVPKRNVRIMGDVTINDFANSSVASERLKKAQSNQMVREVKQLSKETDERAWDEKLDEYDGNFQLVEDTEEGTEVPVLVQKPTRRTRKKTVSSSEDDRSGGYEYPLDLWYLISEYIEPEDVGTFARLCRSSYHVVNTAHFWFQLYKRYYKATPGLPERLQPNSLVRLYGLRAFVIQALHYFYPPLVSRVLHNSQGPIEGDYMSLVKRKCILAWHQKVKGRWIFYFKFLFTPIELYRSHTSTKELDLIEQLSDVGANTEEGCKVLRVSCGSQFFLLPPLLGNTLNSFSIALSHNLAHHKINLIFSEHQVILDPVMTLRVLDWWHPSYPHQSADSLPSIEP